jgi:hypothetical protein
VEFQFAPESLLRNKLLGYPELCPRSRAIALIRSRPNPAPSQVAPPSALLNSPWELPTKSSEVNETPRLVRFVMEAAPNAALTNCQLVPSLVL